MMSEDSRKRAALAARRRDDPDLVRPACGVLSAISCQDQPPIHDVYPAVYAVAESLSHRRAASN